LRALSYVALFQTRPIARVTVSECQVSHNEELYSFKCNNSDPSIFSSIDIRVSSSQTDKEMVHYRL
jgi:hypothetical protein